MSSQKPSAESHDKSRNVDGIGIGKNSGGRFSTSATQQVREVNRNSLNSLTLSFRGEEVEALMGQEDEDEDLED